MSHAFEIQAVRHATMVITVDGRRLLVDPMLSGKDEMPASKLTANNGGRIPLTELPVAVSDLLDVDAVLLTHLHFDHFDARAEELLPRDLPVFCQPGDEARLVKLGFARVIPVDETVSWQGVTLHRVDGNHGTGVVRRLMGASSGFVLEHPDGDTLYIGGDALFDELFEANLDRFKPDVVVLYGGEARLIFGGPITMGSEDVVGVCLHAPDARVVVVHMEALNHCGLTRERLESDLAAIGLAERVAIPADGEIVAA